MVLKYTKKNTTISLPVRFSFPGTTLNSSICYNNTVCTFHAKTGVICSSRETFTTSLGNLKREVQNILGYKIFTLSSSNSHA